MEKLKSVIPDRLSGIVANSNTDDLHSISSLLLDFLINLSQFHQVILDLTDPKAALCAKNKDAAMEMKQKANKYYKNGDYDMALACYSRALRVAPMDAAEMDKNLVAILYLNRASLFHKKGLLTESLRDCNRALQIFPNYAKAWYRRGKVNAALHSYENAVNDLNVAKNLESSFDGKKQIENELEIIADQFKSMGSRSVRPFCSGNSSSEFYEPQPLQPNLSCVTTPDKGRGVVAPHDILQASLVHQETPYALIVMKSCREGYCHYCLNELPFDTVPCVSCSIPLYCSQRCQFLARGETISCKTTEEINKSLQTNDKEHIANVTLSSDPEVSAECFFEHSHECHGVNWTAVLPSDVVLAGRIIARAIFQRGGFVDSNYLDLSHSYTQINPESKLELHIYAIVLLQCLRNSFGFEFPINGVSLSQTIILLSQIRVNAMAVVRMKSTDTHCSENQCSNRVDLTRAVDQVPVGQAIYTEGSLFNHSCLPNIHAYFISRTLFIRTTECVTAGCPLELSYGPQVGESDCKDRLEILEEKYSFRCQCNGCSGINLSDLVINAFHCVDLNCDGVVLDSCLTNAESNKLKKLSTSPEMLNMNLKVDELNNVSDLALVLSNETREIRAGYCLKCNSSCNLEILHKAMRKTWVYIKRLRDAISVKEMPTVMLSDAIRALDCLCSILHRYNKRIAEVHDNIAQALCMVGDLHSALQHCKASVTILEMLYGREHIVIGYELIKISSIQLSLDDGGALDTIHQLLKIFERYYGPHAEFVFPYLQTLQQKLVA